LLTVIGLLMVHERETLKLIPWTGWLGMDLMLAASLLIGWCCGGPGRTTRKAFAISAGVRNLGVAVLIVSKSFAGTPAVSAVVVYSFASIFGTLGCAWLLGRWHN